MMQPALAQNLAVMVAATLGAAIVPALVSRWTVRQICGFTPGIAGTFVAFAVASLAMFVWEQLVWALLPGADTGGGVRLVWGNMFIFLGCFGLLVVAIARLIKDEDGRPIGWLNGILVGILTLILSTPIYLLLGVSGCVAKRWMAG